MEDQDDCVPQDEQEIRDQIDDENVNRDLLEYLDAGSCPHCEGRLTGHRATSGGSFLHPRIAFEQRNVRPNGLNLYASQHKSH